MRTVIQVHDLTMGALRLTQLAPSLGNQCAHARSLDGFENKLCHLVRLFYDNAAKTDVYRGWPLAQETIKFIVRAVLGRIPEEEATDIFDLQAASACNWNEIQEKVETAETVEENRKESHLCVQANQRAWERVMATSNK